MVRVRKATFSDVSVLWKIARDYAYNDALVELAPVSDARVIRYLTDLVAMDLVFIAEDGESREVKGAIALQPSQWWFSDGWFLNDLFLFVLPEHRKSSAAVALVKAARKVAEEKEALLQLSIINGKDVDRKRDFYERMGFSYVGGIFVNAPAMKVAEDQTGGEG